MSHPVADYASDLITRLWKRAEGFIVMQGVLLALPPAMILYGMHNTVRRSRAQAEVRERLRARRHHRSDRPQGDYANAGGDRLHAGTHAHRAPDTGDVVGRSPARRIG